MKILFLVGLLAATSVRADVSCEDCLSFTAALSDHLLTKLSLFTQATMLAGALCPDAADMDRCLSELAFYWPQLAPVLYPEFLQPDPVCAELGACAKDAGKSRATCDECKAGLVQLVQLFAGQDKIEAMVAFLSGDFCTSMATDNCQEYVANLMPKAVPLLGRFLVENDKDYCCELSANGVCC